MIGAPRAHTEESHVLQQMRKGNPGRQRFLLLLRRVRRGGAAGRPGSPAAMRRKRPASDRRAEKALLRMREGASQQHDFRPVRDVHHPAAQPRNRGGARAAGRGTAEQGPLRHFGRIRPERLRARPGELFPRRGAGYRSQERPSRSTYTGKPARRARRRGPQAANRGCLIAAIVVIVVVFVLPILAVFIFSFAADSIPPWTPPLRPSPRLPR